MPRAKQLCSQPRCPHTKPCPIHRPVPWVGSDRRARLPRNWNKVRRMILKRDRTCKDGRVCGRRSPSAEVDHIIPGDDHHPANLQGICVACHASKTAAEANEARSVSGPGWPD